MYNDHLFSGNTNIIDVEPGAACGNLDRGLEAIYTTSCHNRMYKHGYICQFNGKYYIYPVV